MPQILTSDDLAGKAQALWSEAIAILQNDESTAEDFEKAERIQADAGSLMERSKAIAKMKLDMDESNIDKGNNPLNNEPPPAGQQAPDGSDGFASAGKFFKSIFHLRQNGIADDRLKFFQDGDSNKGVTPVTDMKALAESVGATGGFLVPQEFQARILSVMETETLIRPRAEIIRMNRRTVSIPTLDQTAATAGVPSFFGGIQVYYTEEAGQLTETEPTFRNIQLSAHTLTAYTRASDQLLDDSAISLEDFLMGSKGFPGAMAWYEDFYFLNGDGNGKPLGITNSSALISQTRSGANLVDYDDVTGMMSNLMPSSNAIWIASQSVMQQLMIMNGPSGNPSYLWGNAEQGFPNTLVGLPIYFTDKLPVLGDPNDIILIDPSYYLVGDRQMITVDMSREERFRFNQMAWRANLRHDGQPWLSTFITYQDTSTTVSPFVGLAA